MFFGASSGGVATLQLEIEARGRVHPRGEHVVGVAGPGHGVAAGSGPRCSSKVMTSAMHLAGMRPPRQPVDDRHRRVLAPAPISVS